MPSNPSAATSTTTPSLPVGTRPSEAPSPNDIESPLQQQIRTASAALSVSGPCRSAGDMYLTCVATAGLGMCKPYRYAFQDCVRETEDYGRHVMKGMATQVCSHIEGDDEEEKVGCAAGFVLGQMMNSAGRQ